MKISVFAVEPSDISEQRIRDLTRVLSYDEPAHEDSARTFWLGWFSEKIEGEKRTVVAEKHDATTNISEIVGVVRLWRTPYVNHKWLIEGLEVISTRRRQGIGKSLLEKAIELLSAEGVDKVSVNISRNNTASVNLHISLGFEKSSTGSLNSYGNYRQNVDQYSLVLQDRKPLDWRPKVGIEFVRATEDDASFIRSLFPNEEFERIFSENNTSVEEWKERFAYFEDRYNFIVVDACSNEKIGWLMYEVQGTKCILHLVALRLELIGRAYGFRILEKMERVVASQAKYIELDVQQGNVRAVDFYKRNGFQIIGEEEQPVGNGHELYYKMKKNLGG